MHVEAILTEQLRWVQILSDPKYVAPDSLRKSGLTEMRPYSLYSGDTMIQPTFVKVQRNCDLFYLNSITNTLAYLLYFLDPIISSNSSDLNITKDFDPEDFLTFIYVYFNTRDPSSFGAWLVFMEMSLALLGLILNLTVLISIKEKESLSNNTVTIVLANLCFANLVNHYSTPDNNSFKLNQFGHQ